MSSMSARDKKILLAIVPVALVLAFWFLVLSPKRAEVATLDGQVATAQQQRDDAVTKAGSLEGARETYAKDYETVVRLGKAVPSSIDMPSLLVQLEAAAKGTKIKFASVKAGDRSAAPAATSTSSSASGSSSAPPVAAGGAQAQSGAGQSAEKANNAAATSNQASSTASQSSAGTSTSTSTTPSTTTPSTTSPSTGTPAAGASATTASSGAQGLDSVPLNFTFTGSYFDLADFFHQMKRFVRMANGDVQVKGRLLTIDKVTFDSTTFPKIKADITATVYLSPKSEGTTAGGTPSGPQATSAAATQTPAAASGSTTPTPAPASGGSAQ